MWMYIILIIFIKHDVQFFMCKTFSLKKYTFKVDSEKREKTLKQMLKIK